MLVLYKTKCQLSILNEAKFYCAHRRKIPSYKNFSGKCVFKWLLIVFHLKSLRIGLGSFSVRECTFVQKRNECNDLEVRRLVCSVLTVLRGRWCAVMVASYWLCRKSSSPPLRVRVLPPPLRSSSFSSWCHWAEWCLLPLLSDSTGCGCLQQSPWHHRDPHLIPARAAHWPPLTNGPETAFLCTNLKRTSFLVPSVCLVGLRREVI